MFFLYKEWRDAEDGIEMVALHWATTPRGQRPNWKRTHSTTVMIPQSGTYPVVRSCPLWVILPFPRTRSLTVDAGADSGFLLHSYCEVTQRGRNWSTEVTTQEVRAEMITYSDVAGEYTRALLYYSLGGLTHASRVPMRVEGLSKRYQCPAVLPERESSDREYRLWTKRSQLIAQLPLPRTFLGEIWGPVGTRAFYGIYVSRQWTYNPFAEGGMWVLQGGRPWQIEL